MKTKDRAARTRSTLAYAEIAVEIDNVCIPLGRLSLLEHHLFDSFIAAGVYEHFLNQHPPDIALRIAAEELELSEAEVLHRASHYRSQKPLPPKP